MNESDQNHKTSTWPPPGMKPEQGNNDKTVIGPIPAELLQKLRESGSFAIDDPDAEQER